MKKALISMLALGALAIPVLAARTSDTGMTPLSGPGAPEPAVIAPSCSAGSLEAGTKDQGEDELVRGTRDRIIAAAVQCDYDLLEQIAAKGFTASFGGGDPATLWRSAEEAGDPALATLVHILRSPHVRTQDGTYVWPSLVSGDADAAELDRLEDVLGRESDGWFLDGMYVGPRVGIEGDGEWVFYVAGD